MPQPIRANRPRVALRLLSGAIVIVLLAAAAAVALRAPDLRRRLGLEPHHPGYEWLHRALAEADRSAGQVGGSSRRGASQAAAGILEQAIRYSRARARQAGTAPIPPAIDAALRPHFPDALLDRVRWTLASDRIGLGAAVAAWYGREGGAVTLDDVIVFSDRRNAANLVLWAHELTHALQYEQLGIAGFARVYSADHRLLEAQAWRNAFRVAALHRAAAARASRPGPVPAPPPSALPPAAPGQDRAAAPAR